MVEEKRINLSCPIWVKEIAIISMFSDNVQYQIRETLKVLLITNEEKQLPEGELNVSVERKLITTPLDAKDNIVNTDKLACVMEMVPSFDELDSTENLKDGRLCNVLLRNHVTGSQEFTSSELVALHYKRLKNGEFTFLTLRIMDQKDKGVTDGLGMTIALHIR